MTARKRHIPYLRDDRCALCEQPWPCDGTLSAEERKAAHKRARQRKRYAEDAEFREAEKRRVKRWRVEKKLLRQWGVE